MFGTDAEVIVSIKLHSSIEIAEEYRHDLRAEWNGIPQDGVYYGKLTDGQQPCWCVIRPVRLDDYKFLSKK